MNLLALCWGSPPKPDENISLVGAQMGRLRFSDMAYSKVMQDYNKDA